LAIVTVTVLVIVQDAEAAGARATRALALRPKATRANAYFMLIAYEKTLTTGG
jgi:hypothetical protein